MKSANDKPSRGQSQRPWESNHGLLHAAGRHGTWRIIYAELTAVAALACSNTLPHEDATDVWAVTIEIGKHLLRADQQS